METNTFLTQLLSPTAVYNDLPANPHPLPILLEVIPIPLNQPSFVPLEIPFFSSFTLIAHYWSQSFNENTFAILRKGLNWVLIMINRPLNIEVRVVITMHHMEKQYGSFTTKTPKDKKFDLHMSCGLSPLGELYIFEVLNDTHRNFENAKLYKFNFLPYFSRWRGLIKDGIPNVCLEMESYIQLTYGAKFKKPVLNHYPTFGLEFRDDGKLVIRTIEKFKEYNLVILSIFWDGKQNDMDFKFEEISKLKDAGYFCRMDCLISRLGAVDPQSFEVNCIETRSSSKDYFAAIVTGKFFNNIGKYLCIGRWNEKDIYVESVLGKWSYTISHDQISHHFILISYLTQSDPVSLCRILDPIQLPPIT